MKNIDQLREWATQKDKFTTINDYISFGRAYLEYRNKEGFQAEIVSRNTPQYRFFQYRKDADYQITRPINSLLFYDEENYDAGVKDFRAGLLAASNLDTVSPAQREALNRVIYTCQQAIGAALDALPAARSNTARKVNGDLFERFIQLAIEECGVSCRSGVLTVPVKDDVGIELFGMNYQHDLMLEVDGELKAIGSVKTSSKDRFAKVFMDKFLYNRLTGIPTPHFAIFLNDVQRAGKEPNYGTSNTFLAGHFKGYTIKLNPLDGVYYCDLLPQMAVDPILKEHISSIDNFFVDDLPRFIQTAPHIPIIDESDEATLL